MGAYFDIEQNGITIAVEDWRPEKKNPVLTVSFAGKPDTYKVASFSNEEAAIWFAEICEIFFKGGRK